MMLGNSLKNIIIALDAYYKKLRNEKIFYQWQLANGATHKEALLPFIADALKTSFNPLIAGMAILGLISLPGTMTGQILAGNNPNIAVKYQIMLMITIFSSAILNVVLTIWLTNKQTFDGFYNLKKDIFPQ